MLPCIIGQIDKKVCDGMKTNGCCKVYARKGVAARNYRMGICNFNEIRKPVVVVKSKARVGQQKQAKQKDTN